MIIIFNDSFNFNEKTIPKTILGNAPFIAEPYFGHRTRLYDIDLHKNPESIANIIKTSYDLGVKSINLVNDSALLEAYDIASNDGCKMDVVASIGKHFGIDYTIPGFVKAKEVDWQNDIDVLSSYNPDIMLVDEFLVDGYDWDLTSEILEKINETNSFAGLITNFPIKTTGLILENLDLELFEFYMVPINKLGYMMDSPMFIGSKREEFENNLKKLNKKVIASKVLACGILMPQEAFNFINSLDYIDLITVGIASENEAKTDFNMLFDI